MSPSTSGSTIALKQRVGRFAITGILSAAITQTMFWGLIKFGLQPVIANVVAVTAALFPNYILSRTWTWADRESQPNSTSIGAFAAFVFAGVVSSAALVNVVQSLSDRFIVLAAASMTAFALVAVLKFVALDRYVFGGGGALSIPISLAFVGAFRLLAVSTVGTGAPPFTDERHYWQRSAVWLDLFGVRDLADSRGFDEIVGRGWFTPGMSLILAPARAAHEWAIAGRLWVALISLFLLAVLAAELSRHVRPWAVVGVVAYLGLSPFVVWLSMGFWGGHIGGMTCAILLLWTVRMVQSGSIDSRRLVVAGLFLGAAILTRPTSVLIVPAMFLAVAFTAFDTGGPRRLPVRWLTLGLGPVLLIFPWARALRSRFGFPWHSNRYVNRSQLDPEVRRP